MPWRNRASYGQPIRYDAHPLLQATSKASPAAAQPAPEASPVNAACPAQVPPRGTGSNSAPCEPRSHPYRRGAPISVHNLAKPICPHPPATPLPLAKAIPCLPKGGLSVPSRSPRQPWGLPFSTPLPPPPPRPVPRSLLPKQCSGSAQPKTSWQAPAQQGTSLKTSAPLHRIASPRPRPPALTSGFTSSYSQQANLRESLMEHWRSILAVFAEHSQLHRTCIASMHPMEILRTSLRRFAASTISQYLKILQTCLVFWQSMLWSPTALSLPQLADFLQVCQSSQEEDRPALKCSPKQAVEALSWLARTAQIADLATLLSNTLIRSFSLPCAPQERKEALPLPLATLVAWEQKLLQPDCPASLGLLLGGVLLAAHCSLRFKDLQRISFHSLSLSAHALRGTCWATKTTSQGQPFACQPFGFTGTSTSTSWVVAWLRLLEQAWQATKTRFTQDTTPDFLLPCLSPLDTDPGPAFTAPMSFFQALSFLRWALQTPWLPPGSAQVTQTEALAFTLHSLKTCLLSASAQLRLPEDSRRLQGHHKLSSAQLYSRDDTIEALWLQKTALNRCTRWLEAPATASSRGTAPHHRTAICLARPCYARCTLPRRTRKGHTVFSLQQRDRCTVPARNNQGARF